MAVYQVRPFGYVRFAMFFGSVMAQTHNMNKTRGRDRTWKDYFPVTIQTGRGARVSDKEAIEMFKLYNTMRGY